MILSFANRAAWMAFGGFLCAFGYSLWLRNVNDAIGLSIAILLALIVACATEDFQ